MTASERAQITFGLLVPSFNTAVEPELESIRPSDIQHRIARFVLDADVLENIAAAGVGLASGGCNALAVGIATDSFPSGLDLLRRGIERLTDATGLAVYTPSFATFDALRMLGAETVSIVTPFDDASNELVRAAAQSQGFRVSAIVGLDRPGLDQIANTPLADVRAAFARADSTQTEALVQVGTGLPIVQLIDELEQRFAKPVVASNPALYWRALRGENRGDRLCGFGRLLAKH